MLDKKEYDCIIVGGGPCGVATLLYLSQAGYKCCIIEEMIVGGQPVYTTHITNLVGFEGDGNHLIEIMGRQVRETGCDFHYDKVIKINSDKMVTLESGEILYGKTVVISTGSKPRKLDELCNLDNVHYCSLCDGDLYKDKYVTVIGGGNSALTEAIYLSKICKGVTILATEDYGITATKSLIEELADNVEIVLHTSFDYYDTKDKLLYIENYINETRIAIKAEGIFVSIGREANSDFINCNKRDTFLKVNKNYEVLDNEFTLDGIFAGGDVIDKPLKQISTAIADGVKISDQVMKYLRRATKNEN